MALIKCSECGKEISDKAGNCPHCGNPIHEKPVDKKIEIERTNKKWKKIRLWALAILAVGFISIFKSVALGISLILIAFIIGMVANWGAWWTNG